MKRLFASLLLCLLGTAHATSVVTDSDFVGGSTANTVSCDVDAGSATDPALITFVVFGDTVSTIDSVTANSTSMTAVGSEPDPIAGTHAVAAYVLTGVSGSQDVVVTLTGANTAEMWCVSIVLDDVDQTTPVRDFGGTSAFTNNAASIEVTIDSSADDIVLAAIARNEGAGSTTSSVGSSIASNSTSDRGDIAAGAGTAPTITTTWTTTSVTSVHTGILSLSVQGPTGGGPSSSVPAIYRHLRQMKQ